VVAMVVQPSGPWKGGCRIAGLARAPKQACECRFFEDSFPLRAVIARLAVRRLFLAFGESRPDLGHVHQRGLCPFVVDRCREAGAFGRAQAIPFGFRVQAGHLYERGNRLFSILFGRSYGRRRGVDRGRGQARRRTRQSPKGKGYAPKGWQARCVRRYQSGTA